MFAAAWARHVPSSPAISWSRTWPCRRAWRSAVRGSRAGELLRQVVGKLGKAGGHDRRAGGTVRLSSTTASAVEEAQAELRRRLLKALRIDECRGHRLVALREMLQNLQG